MDEQKLIASIHDIIESEDIEHAQKFIDDLYRVYSRFNQTSNRVLRVLRQFLPNSRAKIGLAECILSFIEDCGPCNFNSLSAYVHKEFEYTITNKSISDSLYRLKTIGQITSYYDRQKKCSMYKVSKTFIPQGEKI